METFATRLIARAPFRMRSLLSLSPMVGDDDASVRIEGTAGRMGSLSLSPSLSLSLDAVGLFIWRRGETKWVLLMIDVLGG